MLLRRASDAREIPQTISPGCSYSGTRFVSQELVSHLEKKNKNKKHSKQVYQLTSEHSLLVPLLTLTPYILLPVYPQYIKRLNDIMKVELKVFSL